MPHTSDAAHLQRLIAPHRGMSKPRHDVDDGARWTASPPQAWRTKLNAISRGSWSAHSASPEVRLAVWWRSVALDRALAEGHPPAHSAQLELRAQQLASARVRWSLARSIRDVVAKAGNTPAAPALTSLTILPPSAPLRSPPPTLMAAQDALLELADALTDPRCTSIQGIARVSWMLGDAADSPLYDRIPARVLQHIASEAIVALRGEC